MNLPALGRLSQIASQQASDFAARWRIRRAQEFVRCANATADRSLATAQVCTEWSLFADECLTAAFEETQKLFPVATRLALFAYGKLGAGELNLSSDVDLVLVADTDDAGLSEWVRCFRRLLQDVTEFGFCFRLDFDLRPGGRLGPLVPTVAQFEDYFSNYGEAWERLAFVRFRAVCGDPGVMKKCVDLSRTFTYRKHLDFTLMEDLKVLRQKNHEQNWRRSADGALDLKLGLGGIRDLELFVHTQQVIHGGRDPQLRVGSTETALQLLADKKVLSKVDAEFLTKHYWELRHFENLLQAATDRQIQVLPAHEWLELIPALERARLSKEMLHCQNLVSDLLGPVDPKVHSLPETETEQRDWLKALGFSDDIFERIWKNLAAKNVLSRQPERDELYRRRFLFEIVERLAKKSRDLDLSLEILSDFLKAIRAKAAFFHLLLQRPELLDRLALLFSSSPYLSRILIERPELLDSFLYQVHEPGREQDWEQLLSTSIEKKLLTEMTAGLEFLNQGKLEDLIARLSQVADETVLAVLEKLKSEFRSGLGIIAMGKWGGRELGLRSDLDLVFIIDDTPTEEDFKVARRLISRLTEVQKGGALYQLDFRLKPQGKGGLLLTRREDLLQYLRTESNPWERQAYLKARELGRTSNAEEIWSACILRGLSPDDWSELEKIHQALLQKAKGPTDLKYSPGGLVEVEFVVQLTRLARQEIPFSSSTLEEMQALSARESAWQKIRENYMDLRTYEQLLQLVNMDSLATLLRLEKEQLSQRIQSLLHENAALLAPLDPRTSRG